MEPISLITAALLAGVVTGVGQSAANAVQDAYSGLRDALKRRLAGKPAAQHALEQYVVDPEEWKSNLEAHLRQAGAGQDRAVVEAAALVMQLTDPVGAIAGKYAVNLAGAQGVQIGDQNQQSNVFNPPPIESGTP
jgi:hypothetical protein